MEAKWVYFRYMLLLVVAVFTVAYYSRPTSSMQTFREFFKEYVETNNLDVKINDSGEVDTVVIIYREEETHLYLGRVFAQCNAEPLECNRTIDFMIQATRETYMEESTNLTLSTNILPVLRPPLQQDALEELVVKRRFLDAQETYIEYVINREKSFSFISKEKLASDNMSEEELHLRAMANLRNYAFDYRIEKINNLVLVEGDALTSSLLFLPEQLEAIANENGIQNPIMTAPVVSGVILAEKKDVQMLQDFTEELFANPAYHPASREIFALKNGTLSLFSNKLN